MGLEPGFQDGLIFGSGLFVLHQDVYSYAPKKPVVCDNGYMILPFSWTA